MSDASDPIAALPAHYGLREAARRLGVDPGWLSRAVRKPGHAFAPDGSLVRGPASSPLWSAAALARLAAYRRRMTANP